MRARRSARLEPPTPPNGTRARDFLTACRAFLPAAPQIRSLRLSHKTAHARPKPTSEQEFLHYQWFADFGNADAARAVAHLLSHGEVRDYGGAVRYLQQAAAAGDPDAMAHLGHMHANGLAVKPDNASAWRWFWRAAEKGECAGRAGWVPPRCACCEQPDGWRAALAPQPDCAAVHCARSRAGAEADSPRDTCCPPRSLLVWRIPLS